MKKIDDAAVSRRTLLKGLGFGAALAAAPAGMLASTKTVSAAAGGDVATGSLRVGILWQAGDTFDPNRFGAADMAYFRQRQVYEGLAMVGPKGETIPILAESWESNAAGDKWTYHLRRNAVWHDGTPFTADDVVYSLKRIFGNPDFNGGGLLSSLDSSGIAKIDDHTVQFSLQRPSVIFAEQMGNPRLAMIKNGQTDFTQPVGTGPFKFISTQGQQREIWEAFLDYWDGDRPRVAQVEFLGLSDPQARLNALLAGQVDLIELGDISQYPSVRANPKVTAVVANTDAFYPFFMRASVGPTVDSRVRLAFKLLVDRQQLVQQAQFGLGSVGNDIFAPDHPDTPKIPQRERDVDRAKFLLREAGYENLRLPMSTTDARPVVEPSCVVFAEQCREAGVTIDLTRYTSATYYNESYRAPSLYGGFQSGGRSFLNVWNALYAPTSGLNDIETQWKNERAQKIFGEAIGTTADNLRREMIADLAQLLHDEGTFVIWGFGPGINALGPGVSGVEPHNVRQINNQRVDRIAVSQG